MGPTRPAKFVYRATSVYKANMQALGYSGCLQTCAYPGAGQVAVPKEQVRAERAARHAAAQEDWALEGDSDLAQFYQPEEPAATSDRSDLT